VEKLGLLISAKIEYSGQSLWKSGSTTKNKRTVNGNNVKKYMRVLKKKKC